MSTDKLKVEFSEGWPTSQAKCTNKRARWEQVRTLFQKPLRTNESHARYLAMEQDQRGAMKLMAGWICAAAYKGHHRKKSQIIHLGLLTFDCDKAAPELLANLTDPASGHELQAYEFQLHTTRSHTLAAPRFRLIFPLTRPVRIDEYVAIVRLMARIVDPDMAAVDHVSFRPAQLMYLPSCSADQEYIQHLNRGKALDPDEFLAEYPEWTDFASLPRGANEKVGHQSSDKADDPWEKEGIVGDFCRAYPVEEAMELTPGTYALGDGHPDGNPRYTYLKGTGANGVVVYDDGRFIYSHHGSDPCGDRLCNAFDMVRLHRFGDLDDTIYDEKVPITSMPSYKAMVHLAIGNDRVKAEIARSRLGVLDMFVYEDEDASGDISDGASGTPCEPDDHRPQMDVHLTPSFTRPKPPNGWQSELILKGDGSYARAPMNVHLIVANDPRLYYRIVWDELTQRPAIRGRLKTPGDGLVQVPQPDKGVFMQPMTEMDGRKIKALVEYETKEGGYGLGRVSQTDVDQAVALVAAQHPVNEARDFFEACALEWDGVDRVSTMFARHLGEVQDPYVAEVGRLFCLGIVTRTYEPGHKFDSMLVIQGAQGVGKSSYPAALIGSKWVGNLTHGFEDTNKMIEQCEGKLIMEVGELSGLARSEAERVKEQITVTRDRTRLAYGRTAQDYPLRLVRDY